MASVQSTARVVPNKSAIAANARKLYDEIMTDIKESGIRTRSTPHGIGYMWNGSISQIAHRLWPELTIETGRTGPASKKFLETIKKFLVDTKNIIWLPERTQYYVSPDYKEARVRKGATTTAPAQESVTARARRVWERARAFCETGDMPTETYTGVEFWHSDRPLAQFIKAEFPELYMPSMERNQGHFEKYLRPLYDLLRATTNAVNVGSKHFEEMQDGEHHWLIRKEWHDSHEAFQMVFPPTVVEVQESDVIDTVEAAAVPVIEAPEELTHIEAVLTPKQAVEVLYKLINDHKDLEAAHAEAKATVERLTTENAELNVELKARVDGKLILELLEGVLNRVYDGSIGISRALADVEDVIRQAKEV